MLLNLLTASSHAFFARSFGQIGIPAPSESPVHLFTPTDVITGSQRLVATEQELLRSRLQQASSAASARAAHLSESDVDALIYEARA